MTKDTISKNETPRGRKIGRRQVLIGKTLKDGHEVAGAVLANGAPFLQLKGS